MQIFKSNKIRNTLALFVVSCLLVCGWLVTRDAKPSVTPSGKSDATTQRGQQTDEQIKATLGCGRVTADYRETDVFCSNISLYRQLQQRGIDVGEQGSGDTVRLVIVKSGAGGSVAPAANVLLRLVGVDQVQCIKAPCPPVERALWEGSSDDIGVVTVPRSIISGGIDRTIRVESGDLRGDLLYGASPSRKVVYVVSLYAPQP